ncbi:MAG: hypothetical protein U1E62_11980 [Alsobacter sp.]
MNAVRARFMDCANLPQSAIDHIISLNVSAETLGRLAPAWGEVVFDGPGRFSFPDEYQGSEKPVPAVLFAAPVSGSDYGDIIAWSHKTRRVGSWCGAAAFVGYRDAFRLDEDGAVPVHPSVLAWLQDDMNGIVLVEPRTACLDLVDCGPLLAHDADQAAELLGLYQSFIPRIIVEERSRP